MTKKNLLVLAAITIVAVIAAVGMQGRKTTLDGYGHRVDNSQDLFPELLEQINNVHSIMIESNNAAATLLRGDTGWQVVDRQQYPADTPKVKKLLLTLAAMQLEEAKTTNPDYYTKLGVGNPAEDKVATRVSFTDLSGKQMGSVIVGKMPANGPDGTYLRKTGHEQSWRGNQKVDVPAAPANWLEKLIVDVLKVRVGYIRIRHPDGHTVTLERSNPSVERFTLKEKPENAELKDPYTEGVVASALDRLMLTDVEKQTDEKWNDAAAIHVEYRTFDGLVLRLKLYKHTAATLWARVRATYNKKYDNSAPENGQFEDGTAYISAVVDEVKAINNRTDGWQYLLAGYKANHLLSRVDDFIKEKS